MDHKLVIIVPAFNEASGVASNVSTILGEVEGIPGFEVTLLVINDGSSDDTAERVLRLTEKDRRVRLLSLTRHCGKEAAILAGLEQARRGCDLAIVMDSDLQHPPTLIADMLPFWQQGYRVVEAVKNSRGRESKVKRFLVSQYYRLFGFLTKLRMSGDTDFKLLDRSVVDAYCDFSERHRYFRGLIKWMNYPTARVAFDVPASTRSNSSWGGLQLFRYALSSITSFSAFPLQLVTLLGGLTFLVSLVIGAIALFDKLSGNAVDGFTTVILLILLIGSVLMFSVGLIGTYIGRIYDEVKNRPGYVVDMTRSKLDTDND